MAMIQEAYVSLETAKLLKEKGFNELCQGFYSEFFDNWQTLRFWSRFKPKSYHTVVNSGYVLVPTQQMAMSWLREEKSLHIMVDCIGSKNYNPTIQCFDGNDYAVPGEVVSTIKNDEWVKYGFRSNEEAVEAAIQYCLTELL